MVFLSTHINFPLFLLYGRKPICTYDNFSNTFNDYIDDHIRIFLVRRATQYHQHYTSQ